MSKPNFLFYDLETFGTDPKTDRIAQFGAIRTDADFNVLGEPIELFCKISEDYLPDPGAVLVTGITPQKVLAEGYPENEFFARVNAILLDQPECCVVGYNNIRFDDEMIRYGLWRNFIDPYEWAYKQGNSRWDFLDVIRFTRAVRPDGIEWPVDEEGKVTNRLEKLTVANGISHEDAHDALADVHATIAMAKLIKDQQPKLFSYMYEHRDKRSALQLLESGQPLLHATGKVGNDRLNTTVILPIAPHPEQAGKMICFDLHHDPKDLLELDEKELQRRVMSAAADLDEGEERVPLKVIHANRAPVLAPLAVLDEAAAERIGIDAKTAMERAKAIAADGTVKNRVQAIHDGQQFEKVDDPEQQLYDGFVPDSDKKTMDVVRRSSAEDMAGLEPRFSDSRLAQLFFRYKARNFPESLTPDDHEQWEALRKQRLIEGVAHVRGLKEFAATLQQLAQEKQNDDRAMNLLQEVQLYGETVVPLDY